MAKPHTRTPRRTQVTPNRLADFLAARLAFFSTAISNVRTKKRQEGIFQSWFEFDRKVPIEVVYQVSDSVTQITICPEYPALLRHQLPIPDW
ncbi:MAG: hypothetical protein ACK578_18560 [Pirellula sp.]